MVFNRHCSYSLIIYLILDKQKDHLSNLNSGRPGGRHFQNELVSAHCSVLPVGAPTYPPVVQNILLKYNKLVVTMDTVKKLEEVYA